jgi:hypothetical protein
MDVSAFLAGLPAILGIVGFIVYQLLQQLGHPSPIVSTIVTKLRVASPERVPDGRLTAAGVDRLLRRDDQLRRTISDQDFVLLKKVLNQQFLTAVLVYLTCGGLCVFGVVQYVRQQKQTKIDGITISDSADAARLVDLDPLKVRWKAEGDSSPVRVYLENVNEHTRSTIREVSSADRETSFCPKDYDSVRQERGHQGWNKIRAVIETKDKVFQSDPVHVAVGIRLQVIAEPGRITLASLIDNSLLQNYPFEAELVLPRKKQIDPLVAGGVMTSKRDWSIGKNEMIDWEHAKVVFLAPEVDRDLVRPYYLIDESLGVGPGSSPCAD